ncbi:MAG: FAD-dependent oxidoreductase, partial [Terriglobales bacterium]
MPTVAIIGGGIAGLSAAWELEQAGCRDWLLLEAGPRLGGVIETRHEQGFVLEGGADSFLTSRPAWRELCGELGLGAALVPAAAPAGGAQIFDRGRLHPLPAGWRMLEGSR